MFPMLALLLALAEPPPTPIVGHEYQCSMPRNEEMIGHLTLEEDGTLKTFLLLHYAPDDPVEQAFTAERFDQFPDADHSLDWEAVWRTEGREAPRFEDGEVRLDITTRRTLPKQVAMTLGRTHYTTSGLVTFAERWPGRKQGAQFSFALDSVMALAAGKPVFWSLSPAPLKEFGSHAANRRAAGQFDPARLEALRGNFTSYRAALLAKAADYNRQCARVPIYYDPYSEI